MKKKKVLQWKSEELDKCYVLPPFMDQAKCVPNFFLDTYFLSLS